MADNPIHDEVDAILRGDPPAPEKRTRQPREKRIQPDKAPAPVTQTSATQRTRYKREAVTAIREVNSLLLAGPAGLQRWALSDDPKILSELAGKPPNETESLAGIVAAARVQYPQLGGALEGAGKFGLGLSALAFAAMYLGTRLGTSGLLAAIPRIGPRLQQQYDTAQQHAAEQIGRMQAQAQRAYDAAIGLDPHAQPAVGMNGHIGVTEPL